MRISEIYKTKKQPISFEIFPPKGNLEIEGVRSLLKDLQVLDPAYISVTYSAGGSGDSKKTGLLASVIQNEFGVPASAHLTCINSNKEEVRKVVAELKESGIENILALRGDVTAEAKAAEMAGGTGNSVKRDFSYAKDLIPILKQEGFCVGAACYPEGHLECDSPEDDLLHLYEKQEAGADFFVSQLFFDNACFYDFIEKARAKGINKPIAAGVMPILGKPQISRMIFMCGASLPSAIIRLLNKYENSPEDLRKAGIEYAARQITDLLDQGVDGIHIYTMNQPDIAKEQLEYIKAHRK